MADGGNIVIAYYFCKDWKTIRQKQEFSLQFALKGWGIHYASRASIYIKKDFWKSPKAKAAPGNRNVTQTGQGKPSERKPPRRKGTGIYRHPSAGRGGAYSQGIGRGWGKSGAREGAEWVRPKIFFLLSVGILSPSGLPWGLRPARLQIIVTFYYSVCYINYSLSLCHIHLNTLEYICIQMLLIW